MTQQKTPIRLSGEDLMFLTEAVFAVSSGLGTNETRAKFLSNKEKVRRLMDLHDKYPNDVVEEAMNRLKDVVFSQGEDDGQE
jgi:hypothetical protein